MKKTLLIIAIIIAVLFMIDKLFLNGMITGGEGEQIKKHKLLANPDSLPIGLEAEHLPPALALTTLDGKNVSLADYKGKKVLLNFWATWCGPCRAEMPAMEELYKEYAKEDFVILAVNGTYSEKSKTDVADFIAEYGVTFPILLDEDSNLSRQYQILSIPTSFFIDSTGVIRHKVVGTLSKEYMYNEIMKLP